jgi:hypothetical protein
MFSPASLPRGDVGQSAVRCPHGRAFAALLAQANGDTAAYARYRDRYRDMARTLGYEGHIDWAEAMP